MQIATKVAAAMQAVFGEKLGDLAGTTGCVQRQRKFDGVSLLRTMVLALLQRPAAKDRDYRDMAAKLDVHVTEEAIGRRFTPALVRFLEEALKYVVAQSLAAKPATARLLRKFSDVRIGDSTTILLPDEYADRFPGCGGTYNACKAALKIQVLWSLTAGSLLKLLIEPGRASDNRSPIADTPLPVGALSIFDLGYFSLERFRRIGEAGAYWISRFQRGTTVFGPGGKRLDMPRFLQEYGQNGLADVSAVLGARTDDFLAG